MVRYLFLIALAMKVQFASAVPVAESPSPLIPMHWPGDDSWTITAAIPSPDCDFAVELRGQVEDGRQPIRWARMMGQGEEERATLYLDPSTMTQPQIEAHSFHYTPSQGFLPILKVSSQEERWPSRPQEVLESNDGTRVATIWQHSGPSLAWSNTYRVIPRPGLLPLISSAETELTISLAQVRHEYLFSPESGRQALDLVEEWDSDPIITTHASDGSPIHFIELNLEFGVADEVTTPRRLLPPINSDPGIYRAQVWAAGRSAAGCAAICSWHDDGLDFLYWDQGGSREVPLIQATSRSARTPENRLALCEPMPDNLWLVAYEAKGELNLWMIDGQKTTNWHRFTGATTFEWSIDLSIPGEPIFAYADSERTQTNFPYSGMWMTVSDLVAVRWQPEKKVWRPSLLATLDTFDPHASHLARPAVGRNAAGVATVAFREEVNADITGLQGGVYHVALPEAFAEQGDVTGWVAQ